MLEIIMNFLSCHIDSNNNLIYKSQDIAKYYLKRWFLFDVISTLPPEMILTYEEDNSTFGVLDFFHMLKFIKVAKFFLYS